VQILVNAAGTGHTAVLGDTTDEEIDRVLGVKLRGVLNAVRAVAPAN
jgi:NAD(P)-dependent dehydrogenase (short-subunit alcohol dehydrogenase family)